MPCDPNDDGNVVMVACPTCRAEIEQAPIFSRTLDEKIEERVRSVPDCPSKRDYQERREKYLALQRARQQTEQQKNHSTSGDAAATGASYVTSFLNSLNIGLDTPPPAQAEFYEQEEYWVAAIAFMVFLIAGIVKYSK